MKIIIAIIVVMLFLTSCSESTMTPEQVVDEYWRLHKEGATGEALPLVVEEREYEIAISLVNEDAKPPLSNVLIILDKYMEMTTDGYERDGDTAVVTILISKPKFEEILTNIDMISGNAEYDIETSVTVLMREKFYCIGLTVDGRLMNGRLMHCERECLLCGIALSMSTAL